MIKKAASLAKEMILNTLFKNEQLQSLDNYLVFRNNDGADSMPFLIFEDMLHLLKCFRYRLCSGCSLCPSVFSDENNFINGTNFESVGIPSWLIDNAKYLKMDDGMPLKFIH